MLREGQIEMYGPAQDVLQKLAQGNAPAGQQPKPPVPAPAASAAQAPKAPAPAPEQQQQPAATAPTASFAAVMRAKAN